jgi:hypothetical protein
MAHLYCIIYLYIIVNFAFVSLCIGRKEEQTVINLISPDLYEGNKNQRMGKSQTSGIYQRWDQVRKESQPTVALFF